MSEHDTPTLLAFYLPQYHPIPENDEWWGRGFTEWTNVRKAQPQFAGHNQPHVPSDLGYYDLRDRDVRRRQATLARDAGIGAFAYYHYWFNGHQLLEQPVEEMLKLQEPAFPFMLVWANENWTRRWDGGEHRILMEQHYSLDDDLEHIRALRPALTDDRYLRRDGKPVLGIYRVSKLPDPLATTELWRREVEQWGLPGLYLVNIESCGDPVSDPRPLGFDAAVEFQPSWANLPMKPPRYMLRRLLRWLGPRYSHYILRYDDVAIRAMKSADTTYPRWPGITPGFDNTARRRRNATILTGSSPATYQRWLEDALLRSEEIARTYDDGSGGYVFINAWNEWGEGNHLEPDQLHGRAFLDATTAALRVDTGSKDSS
jgi:lipopolysaccharide biosynthesis protein